jgi:hypothetical protein
MDLKQRGQSASFSRPLALVSVVLTGLLAGAMVFIEVVLLPFWRATSPAEFRQWFTAHSDRIRRLMIPLGVGAGILSTASAVTEISDNTRKGAAPLASAAATAGVIAITVTVNEPTNRQFTLGTLTDAQTSDLLRKWARWHRIRVLLGLIATVAATLAALGRSR